MGQHERDVEIAVGKIAERLKADGPRTMNELRDWFVGVLGGRVEAFQDALKWMAKMTVAEVSNLGRTKMVRLAGQGDGAQKGTGVVRDASVRDPLRPEGESQAERAARLERAADRPFTKDRLDAAQLGRTTGDAIAPATARSAPRPAGHSTDFPTLPKETPRAHQPPASTVAAPPPPSPAPPAAPRSSTSAPSPTAPQTPSLNVGSPARSHDNARDQDDSLSTPPDAPRAVSSDRDPDRPAVADDPPTASTQSPADSWPDGWIDTAKAAVILGHKSRKTTATMIKARIAAGVEMPSKRAGGRGVTYLYRRADIEAWAAERRAEVARTTTAALAAHDRKRERAQAVQSLLDKGAVVAPEASRPELAEHQRQVVAAGLPRVVIHPAPDLDPETVGEVIRRQVGDAAARELGAGNEARYIHIDLQAGPRALLEQLLASGLYGGGTVHDVAERLLLAELRRHVDMPARIAAARR